MAKKPQNTATASAAPPPDPAARVIDAALDLMAARRWGDVSLADIAQAAGLSLIEVYRLYPSKTAILAGFARSIDTAMLEGAAEWVDEKPRDRLFEAILRRFDALGRHKAGLRNLLRDARSGQVPLLPGAVQFGRSMAWTLEATGIPVVGLRGAVRTQILGALYLSVLRTWLQDDSADQARTMALLDRRLRSAERWLGLDDTNASAEPPITQPDTKP
ncbi:MAG TPA: TetR family transcriptional regulator [Stellaceae bacterium]|nr:TetR family transcriptional regulator [Stellaceae bacterium]